MNARKLKQAIIKEVSRSPGKAFVLVALLPVAAYFCFPLCKGFLPKRSAEGAATSTVAEATPSFLLPAATAPATMEPALPDWRQVLNWMATDQLAAPARFEPMVRSPFQQLQPPEPKSSKVETEEDGPSAESGESELTETAVAALPDFDLKLSATMVSGRMKLATINGRVLGEQESIHVVTREEESTPLRTESDFVVVKIEKRTVLLRSGEETIELRLPPDVPENAVIVKAAGD